jgi:hypothetical protein
MADVRGQRIDLDLVAVERQRVVATLLVPERVVEEAAQPFGRRVQSSRELAVVPDLAGEARGPAEGVVGIPCTSQVAIGGSAKRPSANLIASSESFHD